MIVHESHLAGDEIENPNQASIEVNGTLYFRMNWNIKIDLLISIKFKSFMKVDRSVRNKWLWKTVLNLSRTFLGEVGFLCWVSYILHVHSACIYLKRMSFICEKKKNVAKYNWARIFYRISVEEMVQFENVLYWLLICHHFTQNV